MSTRKVVAAGYMPLDIVLRRGSVVARQAGGTASNVAAILAYLGWDSVLAGQTGDDAASSEFVSELLRSGVRVDQIHKRPGTLAPRLVHEISAAGHRFLYRCPDCGSSLPRSLPLTRELARRCIADHPTASAFFFDRANSATLDLAEYYGRSGSLVIFEPSVPTRLELLERALSSAHIVKYSAERFPDGLALQPAGSTLQIVTYGGAGAELRDGRGRAHLAGIAGVIVDAAGAGDWTTAGLLDQAVGRSEINAVDARNALRFGQALATLNCTVPGTRGLTALTRNHVVRRAAALLSDGAFAVATRLPSPTALQSWTEACPTCLLPVADANTTFTAHPISGDSRLQEV